MAEAALRTGYHERTVYRWENGETTPRRAVFDLMRSCIPEIKTPDASFTFIDLFAGIGGLRRGFEPIGGRCVFTCERDRYCQETYRENYDCDHEIAGDIREVTDGNLDRIPAHDVLLAGFPCQPFSIAGVSKKNALNRPHGFACDAQGTLFFDVAEIIRHHRPNAFLLENVKNLVNHDKGRTFRVIRQILTEELDYHIDWKVINAKSWVPQHRERIFIAGFRNSPDFSFDDLTIRDPLTGPKLGAILHPENGSEKAEKPYTEGRQGKVSGKYTLSDHLWQYLQDYAEKHRRKGNGFGFGLFGPDDIARTLSARYYKDGSEILIKQKGKGPRRLTPRECARLMGFETQDSGCFHIPVSDTQAYKQFSGASIPLMVESIAKFMKPYIMESEEGMNTELTYLYRDASNYKFFCSVILSGDIRLSELCNYLHEGDYFIPERVGLKSLVPVVTNEDDHIWHELVSTKETDEQANFIPAAIFKDIFIKQKSAGWI